MAIFNGNPNTTIVINYAPTEGSESAEDHYETLTNAANGIPKHHMVIECGDYNAHLGKESAPYTYHETTNKNENYYLITQQNVTYTSQTPHLRNERASSGQKIADRLHPHKQKMEKLHT